MANDTTDKKSELAQSNNIDPEIVEPTSRGALDSNDAQRPMPRPGLCPRPR
jgi:hypothetical protein